jgi:hypothetical protein
MSWIEFVETHYPDRDFTDFSVWEIGEIDLDMIFPKRLVHNPLLMDNSNEIDSLPYQYIHYWKVGQTILWQCNYCNFWSDIFDQRVMELHLLKCSNVSSF